MQWSSTDLTNMTNVDGRQVYMVTYFSLLLRRFVFRMVEASAKSELLVTNRKGPWKKKKTAGEAHGSQCKKTNCIANKWTHNNDKQKGSFRWCREITSDNIEEISNIYWMRLRIVSRIIQIEQDVNSLRDLHKSVERSSVRKLKLSTACQLLAHCLHLQMTTQNCFPKAQSQYRH